MKVNKYQPYICVLPEDDACRQLANGFLLNASPKSRSVAIEDYSGGWPNVKKDFEDEYAQSLRTYPLGYMVLLVDFDKAENRLDVMQKSIPDDLKERVFVLGVWSNPEKTSTKLKSKRNYSASLRGNLNPHSLP